MVMRDPAYHVIQKRKGTEDRGSKEKIKITPKSTPHNTRRTVLRAGRLIFPAGGMKV